MGAAHIDPGQAEGEGPAPAASPRFGAGPTRMPLYLMLSLFGHAALLLALSRVAFPSVQTDLTRYTRIRLVQSSAAPQGGDKLPVSLPGAPVRPAPIGPAVNGLSAAELQQQMARMNALRSEFFQPMNVVNLPLPVLPAPSTKNLPPLWGWNPDKAGSLPVLPGFALAAPGVSAKPPVQPAHPTAQKHRIATGVFPPQTPGTGLQGKTAQAPAITEAGVGAPLQNSEAAATQPGNTTEAAPAGEQTGATPAPAASEAAVTTPPESENAPAENSATGTPPAKTASEEPTKNPEKPAVAQPPAGGLYASLSGSFRIPLGIHFAGEQDSAAMEYLLKEVSERTQLKLEPEAFLSAENNLTASPLLYCRGETKVKLTAAQRTALTSYIKNGGTLFIDGSDSAFGESLSKELRRIFHRMPVTLTPVHPLYHAYYRLTEAPQIRMFPLQAMLIGGRPAVILSPALLGTSWEEKENAEHEAAVAQGVNLVVYALAQFSKNE